MNGPEHYLAAERALGAGMSHPTETQSIWELHPECASGKHRNCDRSALNTITDDIDTGMCPCDCHTQGAGRSDPS